MIRSHLKLFKTYICTYVYNTQLELIGTNIKDATLKQLRFTDDLLLITDKMSQENKLQKMSLSMISKRIARKIDYSN